MFPIIYENFLEINNEFLCNSNSNLYMTNTNDHIDANGDFVYNRHFSESTVHVNVSRIIGDSTVNFGGRDKTGMIVKKESRINIIRLLSCDRNDDIPYKAFKRSLYGVFFK